MTRHMPATNPPAAADCLTDLLRLEDDAAEIALTPNLPKIRMRFNPAKSLLAALAACMIQGIERVTPILYFSLRGVEVKVDGVRPDMPPKMESITYEIIADTD